MDHLLLGERWRNETRHAAGKYATGADHHARAARSLCSAPLSHGSYARGAKYLYFGTVSWRRPPHSSGSVRLSNYN